MSRDGLSAARLEALGECREEDFAAELRSRIEDAHRHAQAHPNDAAAVCALNDELQRAAAQLKTQAIETETPLPESPARAAHEAAQTAHFWANAPSHGGGTGSNPVCAF
ncbi:MAG: hypothetical protein ABR569_03015 [Gaiellaceae bacterium]